MGLSLNCKKAYIKYKRSGIKANSILTYHNQYSITCNLFLSYLLEIMKRGIIFYYILVNIDEIPANSETNGLTNLETYKIKGGCCQILQLTHLSLASFLWDIGKQRKTTLDISKCDV